MFHPVVPRPLRTGVGAVEHSVRWNIRWLEVHRTEVLAGGTGRWDRQQADGRTAGRTNPGSHTYIQQARCGTNVRAVWNTPGMTTMSAFTGSRGVRPH